MHLIKILDFTHTSRVTKFSTALARVLTTYCAMAMVRMCVQLRVHVQQKKASGIHR